MKSLHPPSATPPVAAAPFLLFTRPSIDEETIAGVVEVLRSGWITTGPKCREFESALSDYFGGRRVLVFNSGTCTMEIALRVAGIGPGDEVITTPLTWVATANVILAVGARPLFVDVDPVTRLIDLGQAEAALTPATRAVIPVDLAGLPVDRDRLQGLAAAHGLRVVEDAAQSIGSTWRGRRIGSFGDLVSFSFHANKNLTTVEGGCLVVSDEAEAEAAALLRLQGLRRSGPDGMDVERPGGKFNLTDVAARIGLGQLPHLERHNARRRELARAYFHRLETPEFRATGLGLPPPDFEQGNWHMFQVELPDGRLRGGRAGVMEAMRAAGIGTGAHYPAVHLFTHYRGLGWKEGDFPHAERLGRNLLTLPLFPGMGADEVDRVCEVLLAVLRTERRP